jgi:4-hydroxybenzoate polyprenyltransferase
MSIIKKIMEGFTSLPLFLAINFVLIVILSTVLYDIEIPSINLLLAFLTTVAIYSLNKVTDNIEDSINRPDRNMKTQAPYGITALICYLTVFIIGALEGILVFLTFLIPLFIGFIYSVKITDDLPRLKELLGVKNIIVAFSWAFTGALIPTLLNTVQINKILLVFIYIFIQLFINTVIFDIIDIPGDKVAKIKTIPLRYGKKKTRQILLLANSLVIPWLIICLASGLFIRYLPIAAFGMFYSYATIWHFTKYDNKRFLAQTLVDGQWIPIVALTLLFI